VAFAAWIRAVNEVELPDWFMATLYGGAAAVAIAVGVLARRYIASRRP
jgi:hypothetical protein